MRISHLPKVVLDRLGLSPGDSAYLKKVQEVYCDRLTGERICPTKCHRCISRLERIAGDMAESGVHPDEGIGLWHRIVQDVTLDVIERYHASRISRPTIKSKNPGPETVSAATAEFLRQLGGHK